MVCLTSPRVDYDPRGVATQPVINHAIVDRLLGSNPFNLATLYPDFS